MSPVHTEIVNRHLKAENKILRELVRRLMEGRVLQKYEEGLLKDAEIHKNFVLKIEKENER